MVSPPYLLCNRVVVILPSPEVVTKLVLDSNVDLFGPRSFIMSYKIYLLWKQAVISSMTRTKKDRTKKA
jgi:hypothetical protein